jgi:hypothetical protein
LFGATSRLVRVRSDHATVDLCTCTGELVERRETDDLSVIEQLLARES